MNIIYYRNNANEEWQSIPALKGDKGDEGATPVKGVDYFTEEEIAGIVEKAAASVDLSEYPTITDMNDYVNEVATELETITVPDMLSDYATIEVVDDALEELKNEVDTELEGYAKVTDLPDMSEYATQDYVDDAVANVKVDVPDVDLEGYATTDYVDNAVAAVPKYDLTAYATKTYVNQQIDALPEYDMSAYALKSHVHEDYALKTSIPDVSKFQTETQVQALIDASLGVIENGSY